jgi:hypothetical protein
MIELIPFAKLPFTGAAALHVGSIVAAPGGPA